MAASAPASAAGWEAGNAAGDAVARRAAIAARAVSEVLSARSLCAISMTVAVSIHDCHATHAVVFTLRVTSAVGT